MSLRELASFQLVDNDGVPPDEPEDLYQSSTSGLTQFFWYPRVGLFTNANNRRIIISMDGLYYKIGNQLSGRPGWWAQAGKVVLHVAGKEYYLDNRGMLIRPVETYSPNTPGGGVTFYFSTSYVRLFDSYYYYDNGIEVMDINGNTSKEHGSFGSHFNEFNKAFTWAGRGDGELFISSYARPIQCFFYSTATKDRSSRFMHLPDNIARATYCPEWGVIVALTSFPYYIKVFSLETKPFEITEPEIISGDATEGRIVTYRVQVLGDADDTCEGEIVNWTVTGEGELLTTQSITDENGYAIAKVRYRIGETGDSTIEASLKC